MDSCGKDKKTSKWFNPVGLNLNTSATIATVSLAAIGVIFHRYKTSRSHEWLVRTGLGVNDIQIGKKFFQFPFQNIDCIKLTPNSYKFSVAAMSKEKMEFTFPAVFTIGPQNDEDSLTKYSRFMLNQEGDKMDEVIRAIIEGETRSLAANQPIEEIFAARNQFKSDIVLSVQSQLNQYGLIIYNANVEELRDSETSNYFKSLSQRIKSEAENIAKVQVAEQNKKGNIGSKEREGETRQQTATIESATTLVENTRQQEMIRSNAELKKTAAEQELVIQKAKIQAEQEAQALRMTMEREVEAKRLEMETEKQRASEMSKSRVHAEKVIKDAEGASEAKKIAADAMLYARQKEAEAELFAKQRQAEAHAYTKQREAEGVLKLYQAQAQGLQQVISTFGGDSKTMLSYMMVEKGIYEKLAQSNADAIRGLNPKITVWTDKADKSMDAIRELGKAVVPMLDTIESQTGYKLPNWILENQKDLNKEDIAKKIL